MGFLNYNLKYFVKELLNSIIRECKKLMNKAKNFSNIPCTTENKTIEKIIFEFKEILCPLTKNNLISNNCAKCKHVQRINAMHISGRTLTTLICLYNLNNEDNKNDL